MQKSNSVDEFLSDFQFISNTVSNISFTNRISKIGENCKKRMNLNYDSINMQEAANLLIGTIILKIDIDVVDGEKCLTRLSYSAIGAFSTKDTQNKDKFEDMIKINGLATLYSIARANILTISSLAGIGEINIPMINVYEYVTKHKK